MVFSLKIFVILGIVFFFIAVVFSMFGLGGGGLYVPILLAFTLSYPVSAGTSLLLIVVGAISATVIYARSGLIDWRFVLAINPLSDLAAFFGGYFLFSPRLLRTLFALVLIASGTFMFRVLSPAPGRPPRKGFFIWNHQFDDRTYSIPLPLILISFMLAGFWSGALGIGGGVFKIPLMVIVCGFPLRIAIATSSLMIAMSSFWGMVGHLSVGTINLEVGIPLAAIVLIGAQIGSRISIKTHQNRLKLGLAVILYLVALRMIISVF